MRLVRTILVALGVLALGYGGWLLASRQTGAQLRQVAEWAVAGVLLHDVLLAPVAVGLGWLGQRTLPRAVAAPASVALVLMGTLSVVAVPVLDGYAAGTRNHTLLDRDYPAGWLLSVGLVLLAIAIGGTLAALLGRHRRREPDGAGPDRR